MPGSFKFAGGLGFWTLHYAKYKDPEVHISHGRLLRNSSSDRTGSRGVFLRFAFKPPERVINLGSLEPYAVRHLRVVMVLKPRNLKCSQKNV